MLLDGLKWQQFLHSFEREAFRLETFPVYRMPQEEETLRRFLAGESLRAADKQGWLDRVSGHVAAGRTMSRVHVLSRPLTDYLRYEFEHYRINVTAGEDIRILDITDTPNPGLPDQDFWLFDETRVVLMNYDADGRQLSRELISSDPEPFVRWKHLALKESVPFIQYVNDDRS